MRYRVIYIRIHCCELRFIVVSFDAWHPMNAVQTSNLAQLTCDAHCILFGTVLLLPRTFLSQRRPQMLVRFRLVQRANRCCNFAAEADTWRRGHMPPPPYFEFSSKLASCASLVSSPTSRGVMRGPCLRRGGLRPAPRAPPRETEHRTCVVVFGQSFSHRISVRNWAQCLRGQEALQAAAGETYAVHGGFDVHGRFKHGKCALAGGCAHAVDPVSGTHKILQWRKHTKSSKGLVSVVCLPRSACANVGVLCLSP